MKNAAMIILYIFLLRIVSDRISTLCCEELTPRYGRLNTAKVDFLVEVSQGPRLTEATPSLYVPSRMYDLFHLLGGVEGHCRAA